MPAVIRALSTLTVAAAVVTAGLVVCSPGTPAARTAAAPAPVAPTPSARTPDARPVSAPPPAGTRPPTPEDGPVSAPATTAVPPRGGQPAPPGPRPRPRPREDWKPRDRAGLTGPVSEVVADAPERGPVRVVTLTSDSAGRPKITVTTAEDRRQATGAVLDARTAPDVLAVTVDSKVSVADEPRPVTAADPAEGTAADPTEGAAGTAAPGPTAAAAATANDTFRYVQWPLDRLSAEAAWTSATGTGQTVAVVDTGVDGSHPDLTGAVLPGADLVTSGGDGRTDPNGHGTHVAGTIAARAGNGLGVAGLAPGARILPVRVLDSEGSGWNSDVAQGIAYAVDHGATVVNLSLGGPQDDPMLKAAIDYALGKDVVVVAAAGNSGRDCATLSSPMPGVNCGNPTEYPAAYPDLITVAATDETDARAVFSGYKPYVDLAAPGVDVASTYPSGRYVYMDGTSMATPHVAAAAALIRARFPAMGVSEVAARLVGTAHDLGAAGRDDFFGAGLIQPLTAVTAADSGQPTPTPDAPEEPAPPAVTDTELSVSGTTLAPGQAVKMTVTVQTASGAPVTGPARLCIRRISASAHTCANVAVHDGTAAISLRVNAGILAYARFTGTAIAQASTSPTATVLVRPRVTAAGGKQRLAFRVDSPQKQRVRVQQYSRGGWRTVRTVTVSHGAYHTVGRLSRGTYQVVVPATADLLPVTSAKISVR
ncbi:type VII secretion-associated serine protease mycosin [Planomonospora sp. ID67723]|uniref:type VII secretion-associated serine protease mycosin n=1 Tax=Planomonospora sp. ID67723 TaxID=2738134 RepID=UPI0018C3CF1F|nr:type VII secretion-associated serine protease mycosin [Planomonospora sp. ID67723]MBG0827339.1 type VII secretion-associated serine protease mycosin [Planomonospora sp. ID67723]